MKLAAGRPDDTKDCAENHGCVLLAPDEIIAAARGAAAAAGGVDEPDYSSAGEP
jgi:hypothetical protein